MGLRMEFEHPQRLGISALGLGSGGPVSGAHCPVFRVSCTVPIFKSSAQAYEFETSFADSSATFPIDCL